MAIVGAGFTGLWTAYYLLRHAPGLRVLVLEAEVAGLRRQRPQRRLVLGAVPHLGVVAAGPARRAGRPRAAPGDARRGRRGRPGVRARGHRRPLREGRHRRRRAHQGAAAAGAGRGGRGADARHRPGRPRPARRGRGPGPARRRPRCSARRRRRTARASTPRGWCAGWPARSSGSAASSTSARRSPPCAAARWTRRTAGSSRATSCGPPRASPPGCPVPGATSRRSTR